MAYEVPLFSLSFLAGEDLASRQFRFVRLTPNGIRLADTPGEAVIGILQDEPGANEAGSVMVLGVSKVVSGGAIARGDELTNNAEGAAIPAGPQDRIHGMALEAAASPGEIITMLIRPNGIAE